MFFPYFGYGYGYDYYWWLLLPAIAVTAWAQYNVNRTFNRYNTMLNIRGLTGAQAAREILDRNGLHDIPVEMVTGRLTDNYDPRTRVVHLSEVVYNSMSVASIGVAAHEVGHAVQHSVGYAPLHLRNAIIPVSKFGSTLAIPLVIAGFLFSWAPLVLAGILFFAAAVLFQVVTLPVEFNASSRALKTLEGGGMLYPDELKAAGKVLRAAAMTYVAATFVALINLLRLVAMFAGMRRRD